MEIKTKFSVGQDVCLFNGVSQEIEHDEVFAILVSPVPVAGKEFNPQAKVSEQLEAGNVSVEAKYQLQHHQGIIDEKILFADDEALKEFFREFFAK